jgi:hypothetical protein
VISHLGGFLRLVAPGIAEGLTTLPQLLGNIDIFYEDNECVITEKISDDEIVCYIDKPTKPTARTFYAGNQGVSVLTKGCAKSFFFNGLENDPVTHPDYTRDRISSFFEAFRHPDASCVRYQSILNYDITKGMGFGMFCSPMLCRLQVSEYGDGVQQTNLVKLGEILDDTPTQHSEYFEDWSQWTTYQRRYTESTDYLLDFQKFTDGKNFLEPPNTFSLQQEHLLNSSMVSKSQRRMH